MASGLSQRLSGLGKEESWGLLLVGAGSAKARTELLGGGGGRSLPRTYSQLPVSSG